MVSYLAGIIDATDELPRLHLLHKSSQTRLHISISVMYIA